jgi:ATP-dependent Zn protease
MRFPIRRLSFALSLLVIDVAEASTEQGGRSIAVDLIVSWAPLAVLLAVWFFFIRRMSRGRVGHQIERSLDHMEKAETHMTRVESKLDRIVSLLENLESQERRSE